MDIVNILKLIRKLLGKADTPPPITIYEKYNGDFFILKSDESLLEKLPKPRDYNLGIEKIGGDLGKEMREIYFHTDDIPEKFIDIKPLEVLMPELERETKESLAEYIKGLSFTPVTILPSSMEEVYLEKLFNNEIVNSKTTSCSELDNACVVNIVDCGLTITSRYDIFHYSAQITDIDKFVNFIWKYVIDLDTDTVVFIRLIDFNFSTNLDNKLFKIRRSFRLLYDI